MNIVFCPHCSVVFDSDSDHANSMPNFTKVCPLGCHLVNADVGKAIKLSITAATVQAPTPT